MCLIGISGSHHSSSQPSISSVLSPCCPVLLMIVQSRPLQIQNGTKIVRPIQTAVTCDGENLAVEPKIQKCHCANLSAAGRHQKIIKKCHYLSWSTTIGTFSDIHQPPALIPCNHGKSCRRRSVQSRRTHGLTSPVRASRRTARCSPVPSVPKDGLYKEH